jgi:hypothetical protein
MGMLIDASELEGRTHTHGRVFVSRTSFGRVVVIDVAAGGGGADGGRTGSVSELPRVHTTHCEDQGQSGCT